MTEKLIRVVKSWTFQYSILAMIIVAAILVGLETDPRIAARYGGLLQFLNRVVLWTFVAEAAIKMGQHGKHFLRYFRDPWNLFDFAIIVVCFLPLHAEYAAVLRLIRVVRALRLITVLPQLQLLVNALLKSVPSMFYVGVMLSLIFYVYAVMGVFLFGKNDPQHFVDLPSAMLSLFGVVTLEGWTDLMYTQFFGSDVYPVTYPDANPVPAVPVAQPVVATLYFVSFVMLGTMIMLNLFIGVILNSMSEAQEDRTRQSIVEQRLSGSLPTVPEDIAALENQLEQLKQNLTLLRLRLETSPLLRVDSLRPDSLESAAADRTLA